MTSAKIRLYTPNTYSLDNNSVIRCVALSNSTFEQQGPGLRIGVDGGKKRKREVGVLKGWEEQHSLKCSNQKRAHVRMP